MSARRSGTKGPSAADPQAVLSRKSWSPLPAIAVLDGSEGFFKDEIIARFSRELFGDAPPEVHRFVGPSAERNLGELPLAAVLDELRTPSFFSPRRLVVVTQAGAFANAHRETFEPYIEKGFGGGHLILDLPGKLPLTTRFAKAIARSGWLVRCAEPYDRPPPWDTRTPVWESDLSRWLVRRAAAKELELDTRTAFALHERAGTDLRVLDEELEKIATFLAAKEPRGAPAATGGSRRVTEEVITAVTGELREDSIFTLVDRILEGRRSEAVESIERLFRRGYHTDTGAAVHEPHGIALPAIATLVTRLRALRRAHALTTRGAGTDDFLRERLVQRPFLQRFQRQLRATPPARVERLLDRLYAIDLTIKRGGDPHRLLLTLAGE